MPAIPVSIPTPDGAADGYLVRPEGEGPWPGVVFYMDGIGLRPALVELAEGIARRGYVVLLPNLFYRAGQAPNFDYERFLNDDSDDDSLMLTMRALIGTLTPDRQVADAGAYLDDLQVRPEVAPGPVAVTGYCMGGSMALRTAAAYPERVAAVASFHGGRLATDDPASPHLLAPRLKAELYLGHAKDDPSIPQEQVDRLEAALDAAGVRHQTEIYDAKHGWTMPDVPWAYDQAAADKAWGRLYDLLDRTLK